MTWSAARVQLACWLSLLLLLYPSTRIDDTHVARAQSVSTIEYFGVKPPSEVPTMPSPLLYITPDSGCSLNCRWAQEQCAPDESRCVCKLPLVRFAVVDGAPVTPSDSPCYLPDYWLQGSVQGSWLASYDTCWVAVKKGYVPSSNMTLDPRLKRLAYASFCVRNSDGAVGFYSDLIPGDTDDPSTIKSAALPLPASHTRIGCVSYSRSIRTACAANPRPVNQVNVYTYTESPAYGALFVNDFFDTGPRPAGAPGFTVSHSPPCLFCASAMCDPASETCDPTLTRCVCKPGFLPSFARGCMPYSSLTSVAPMQSWAVPSWGIDGFCFYYTWNEPFDAYYVYAHQNGLSRTPAFNSTMPMARVVCLMNDRRVVYYPVGVQYSDTTSGTTPLDTAIYYAHRYAIDGTDGMDVQALSGTFPMMFNRPVLAMCRSPFFDTGCQKGATITSDQALAPPQLDPFEFTRDALSEQYLGCYISPTGYIGSFALCQRWRQPPAFRAYVVLLSCRSNGRFDENINALCTARSFPSGEYSWIAARIRYVRPLIGQRVFIEIKPADIRCQKGYLAPDITNVDLSLTASWDCITTPLSVTCAPETEFAKATSVATTSAPCSGVLWTSFNSTIGHYSYPRICPASFRGYGPFCNNTCLSVLAPNMCHGGALGDGGALCERTSVPTICAPTGESGVGARCTAGGDFQSQECSGSDRGTCIRSVSRNTCVCNNRYSGSRCESPPNATAAYYAANCDCGVSRTPLGADTVVSVRRLDVRFPTLAVYDYAQSSTTVNSLAQATYGCYYDWECDYFRYEEALKRVTYYSGRNPPGQSYVFSSTSGASVLGSVMYKLSRLDGNNCPDPSFDSSLYYSSRTGDGYILNTFIINWARDQATTYNSITAFLRPPSNAAFSYPVRVTTLVYGSTDAWVYEHFRFRGHRYRLTPNTNSRCSMLPTAFDVSSGCQVSTCPRFNGHVCSGNGYCNSATGQCYCNRFSGNVVQSYNGYPAWLGDACQYDVQVYCYSELNKLICNGNLTACGMYAYRSDDMLINNPGSANVTYIPRCDCSGTAFTGDRCDVPRCNNNTGCANNATCIVVPPPTGSVSTQPSYVCQCLQPWVGPKCDVNAAQCWFGQSTIACQGRGTCNPSTAKCDCNDGWTGDACERQTCFSSTLVPGHGNCNGTRNLLDCYSVYLSRSTRCDFDQCTPWQGVILHASESDGVDRTCQCPAGADNVMNGTVVQGTCWPRCPTDAVLGECAWANSCSHFQTPDPSPRALPPSDDSDGVARTATCICPTSMINHPLTGLCQCPGNMFWDYSRSTCVCPSRTAWSPALYTCVAVAISSSAALLPASSSWTRPGSSSGPSLSSSSRSPLSSSAGVSTTTAGSSARASSSSTTPQSTSSSSAPSPSFTSAQTLASTGSSGRSSSSVSTTSSRASSGGTLSPPSSSTSSTSQSGAPGMPPNSTDESSGSGSNDLETIGIVVGGTVGLVAFLGVSVYVGMTYFGLGSKPAPPVQQAVASGGESGVVASVPASDSVAVGNEGISSRRKRNGRRAKRVPLAGGSVFGSPRKKASHVHHD